MNRFTRTAGLILLVVPLALAGTPATPAHADGTAPPQDPPASFYSKNTPKDLVEFEMMTWPEVYRAIHHEGKTTALFYTGGTESRGPQDVNGGHNIMAKATVKAIARKLGTALAMPVLPYTPNDASRQATGTIGLTSDILALVLERVSEEAIITGFKHIILMGDHGGGQPEVYQQVAKKLEDKYAVVARNENRIQDVHVYYCNDVYDAAQADFDKFLVSKKLPTSSHAGISDTSTMMYLQGKSGDYTRLDLLPVAVTASGPVPSDVTGDGRQSSVELGKMAFDIKVDSAVRQIERLIAAEKSGERKP
jgi:creatinine amidohydrolase/Fe(II)-dependent formamide hydrolase-like protein